MNYIEIDIKYEPLSSFKQSFSYYTPKRPNSCEKPRNKNSVFKVPGSFFSEIPIINFSNAIQQSKSQNLAPKRNNSLHRLKKITINPLAKGKTKLSVPILTTVTPTNPRQKAIRKFPKSQSNFRYNKLNDMELLRAFKKTAVKVSFK